MVHGDGAHGAVLHVVHFVAEGIASSETTRQAICATQTCGGCTKQGQNILVNQNICILNAYREYMQVLAGSLRHTLFYSCTSKLHCT